MKRLRKLSLTQRGVPISDWNELVDIVNSMMSVRVGPGLESRETSSGNYTSLIKSPAAIVGAAAAGEGGGAGGVVGGFFAEITAYDHEGCNHWAYTWERVQKIGRGFAAGWSGDGTTGEAYNTIEYMNTSVGIEGNGVDVDGADFPAGFSIQPCPVGNIVWMRCILTITGFDEHWFQYESGVDGSC